MHERGRSDVGLIELVVILLVLAVLVWAIQQYLPGEQNLKNIACFVVVVIAVLYVLSASVGGGVPALR